MTEFISAVRRGPESLPAAVHSPENRTAHSGFHQENTLIGKFRAHHNIVYRHGKGKLIIRIPCHSHIVSACIFHAQRTFLKPVSLIRPGSNRNRIILLRRHPIGYQRSPYCRKQYKPVIISSLEFGIFKFSHDVQSIRQIFNRIVQV